MNGAAGNTGCVAAFFDVDGTLVAGPSLERRFFRLLRYRRAIPAGNYLRWLAEAVRLAPRGIEAMRHANKKYLRGVAVGGAGEGGLKPAPTFLQEAVERVAGHALQGHAIVLVSGTLEPLAQEAARALEEQLAGRGIVAAIGVCATRLEVAGERWTGRVIGEAMYGETKARAVRRLAAKMQLDLTRCYAYGDSLSDRWLLAAVGRPVAVNPAAELARMARQWDWPALHWKKKEPPQRHRDTGEFEEARKQIAAEGQS
jgi:HAD superfamily hydrolase (TIGR01490 family)